MNTLTLNLIRRCRPKINKTKLNLSLHTRSISLTSNVSNKLDLSGVYPPIPTPFNEDESIAYDKLEHNFSIWNKIPFRGKKLLKLINTYIIIKVFEASQFKQGVKTRIKKFPETKNKS